MTKRINPHDLCYHSSKDFTEFLFGKLRIRNFRDEPCFPAKRKLLSCQIKTSTLFENNHEINEGNTIQIYIRTL